MLLGRSTIGTIAHLSGGMAEPSLFLKSWGEMIQYNYEYLLDPNQRIEYTEATVSYHSFARNSLVEHMKGNWLLQLDTDISFDPDIAARMINTMDKFGIDVLAGLYLYKKHPHPPVAYGYDPVKDEKIILGDWQKDSDLLRMRSAGAGCLMVRKSVFDRIKDELKCSPFDIYFDGESPLSEDHSFFERCWNLEIPVYVSPNIWVNHLTVKPLTEKDYDKTGLDIQKIDKFW